GDTKVQLPGIGTYLGLASEQRDIGAVGAAVVAMAIVILLYDQLIFRPVVAWADKFRFEATAAQSRPRSWVYDIIRRTRLLKEIVAHAVRVRDLLPRLPAQFTHHRPGSWFVSLDSTKFANVADWFWLGIVLGATVWSLWTIVAYVGTSLGLKDVIEAAGAGLL